MRELMKFLSFVSIVFIMLTHDSFATTRIKNPRSYIEAGWITEVSRYNDFLKQFFFINNGENHFNGFFIGLNYYYFNKYKHYRLNLNLSYFSLGSETNKIISSDNWITNPNNITGTTNVCSSSDLSFLKISGEFKYDIYDRICLSAGIGFSFNTSIENKIKFKLLDNNDIFESDIPKLSVIDEKNAIYNYSYSSFLDLSCHLKFGISYDEFYISLSKSFKLLAIPFVDFDMKIYSMNPKLKIINFVNTGLKFSFYITNQQPEGSPLMH